MGIHHKSKKVLPWIVSFALFDLGYTYTQPLPKSSTFLPVSSVSKRLQQFSPLSMSAVGAPSSTIPSWADLQKSASSTSVGSALDRDVSLRKDGKGPAHVHNTLRKFASDEEPAITLFRDHAGWCPYCEKTMLLIEEKGIPIKISLMPMRSYGDKPTSYTNKVPGGLLPAIEVNGQVITESQVIMELLDQWHTEQDGYKRMLPKEGDEASYQRLQRLARLERELFGCWCNLVFRPEMPNLGGFNPLQKITGGSEMSSSMKAFLDCLKRVDNELNATKGPWFFDEFDYPTMIDFIYVSHVERMLASCAYWKGLDIRDPKWKLKGLVRWLEAFEKREPYLAFKSDYFTHVMDIPPQYGPGQDGGFAEDRNRMKMTIIGRDGSWSLPLPFDDPLQPLYKGMPLPRSVLEACGLSPDADGTFENCDKEIMSTACRTMAAWKLAGNGSKVAAFAARGGPKGAKNPRKSFGAQLADPYANPDEDYLPVVDQALRVVCSALLSSNPLPTEEEADLLKSVVPSSNAAGVSSSLAYLRDRVGVPRDLPLASARYLRAYLNWAIDTLG